jgi:methionyl-tRNA synthetase
MVDKYCDGKIPQNSEAETLAKSLTRTVTVADEAMCSLDFQTGINSIMDFCKEVNGYVTSNEPWVVAKDPSRKVELDAILYNTAESLRALAVLLFPVMPISTRKLWNSLGAESSLGPIEKQVISKVSNWGQLKPGTKTSKGEILFPRLEEAEK